MAAAVRKESQKMHSFTVTRTIPGPNMKLQSQGLMHCLTAYQAIIESLEDDLMK